MADPGRLVVRAPNHLGELVLALPALARLEAREATEGRPPPLTPVAPWLAPFLRLLRPDLEVLALPARRAVLRGGAAIRAAAGPSARAITLTPSFSSALMLRLAGVRALRGTAGGGRGFLLTDRVDRAPLLEGHRVNEFLAVCGFPTAEPPEPPAVGAEAVRQAEAAWETAEPARGVALAVAAAAGPTVGLFPGANGPARRWPAGRFGALATRLASRGAVVLVLGGPGERELTARVAGAGGDGVLDLGGRTSLRELAGALRACNLLVTNDTGPMHLAAALGTPVLALEGPADLRQTRPLGPRVRLVGRFDLPCVPCVKNECPRRGTGYELPEAKRECLRLVGVEEVETVVNEMLSGESE